MDRAASATARVLAAVLALAATAAGAEPPPAAPPPPSITATKPSPGTGPARIVDGHRVITWEALLPPGWDPMKEFRGVDFDTLQDGDARAVKLMQRMREVFDQAPTNGAMEGQAVRLPGFVVPLEETREGLREFLLVPYFGACIHTPPPPANQIIHVRLDKPLAGVRSMDAVWVSGTLRRTRNESAMGHSGYAMQSVRVQPYTGDRR